MTDDWQRKEGGASPHHHQGWQDLLQHMMALTRSRRNRPDRRDALEREAVAEDPKAIIAITGR